MHDLPQEICNEIASQFETAFPYSKDNSRRPRLEKLFVRFEEVQRSFDKRSKPDIQSLRNLRLVSRPFHTAATHVLFRCTQTSIVKRWNLLQDLERVVPASILSSDNSLSPAKQIKHFSITFNPFVLTLPENLFVPVEKVECQWVIRNLSDIVTKTSGIESFILDAGSWESNFDLSQDNTGPLEIDESILGTLKTQLSSAISCGLLMCLTDLRLALPCTRDFLALGTALPEAIALKLRTLFLAIGEATGAGGSDQYTRDEGIWPTRLGEMRSNFQRRYPNEDHAYALFDLAKRCINLTTLGIQSTHRLDCTSLSRGRWRNLEHLYLTRLYISALDIVELFPLSTIRRLWLEGIELTIGTWSTVFIYLKMCHKLEYLDPSNCSYREGCPSFEHRLFSGRPWEDTMNLCSIYYPDEDALLELVKKLVEKAGGRDKYPNFHMEQDMLP